jgi:hypothetical protein
LKHITLVINDAYDFGFRDLTEEDFVRAFCYIRDQKTGVPLECLEILSPTLYSIWENGATQCILTRHGPGKRIEQTWDTRSLELVGQREGSAKPPPEMWGNKPSSFWPGFSNR